MADNAAMDETQADQPSLETPDPQRKTNLIIMIAASVIYICGLVFWAGALIPTVMMSDSLSSSGPSMGAFTNMLNAYLVLAGTMVGATLLGWIAYAFKAYKIMYGILALPILNACVWFGLLVFFISGTSA